MHSFKEEAKISIFRWHQQPYITNNEMPVCRCLCSSLLRCTPIIWTLNLWLCVSPYECCGSSSAGAGSLFSNMVGTILHIGMFSFLLRSFKDGWTSISHMSTLSPISRLLTSTSIFDGMCSDEQRNLRLVRIPLKQPPVIAWYFRIRNLNYI